MHLAIFRLILQTFSISLSGDRGTFYINMKKRDLINLSGLTLIMGIIIFIKVAYERSLYDYAEYYYAEGYKNALYEHRFPEKNQNTAVDTLKLLKDKLKK